MTDTKEYRSGVRTYSPTRSPRWRWLSRSSKRIKYVFQNPHSDQHIFQDVLTHRRPDVTSLAIHPCGHFFAVGYGDGSIAFWAIEDEDKPLLVMTLDGQQDVHIADANRLDEEFAKGKQSSAVREPIFKLAWSGFANSDDPRGGATVLTVLGGLKSSDVPGVTTILLPAFNPPEPPALPTASSTTLHPNVREAMRKSVTPVDVHTYSTVGTPQDFLLLPRENPHFSGTYDPYAILLLSDAHKDARATEAYQFPPPIFGIHKDAKPPVSPKPEGSEEGEDVLCDEIESTLQAMKIQDDPKVLETPPAFWSGPVGVTSGNLISLERDSYESLVTGKISEDEGLRLRGGSAWVDDDEGQMKLLRVCTISITRS